MDDIDRFLHNSDVALQHDDQTAIGALQVEAVRLLLRRDLGDDPRRIRVLRRYETLKAEERHAPGCDFYAAQEAGMERPGGACDCGLGDDEEDDDSDPERTARMWDGH